MRQSAKRWTRSRPFREPRGADEGGRRRAAADKRRPGPSGHGQCKRALVWRAAAPPRPVPRVRSLLRRAHVRHDSSLAVESVEAVMRVVVEVGPWWAFVVRGVFGIL